MGRFGGISGFLVRWFNLPIWIAVVGGFVVVGVSSLAGQGKRSGDPRANPNELIRSVVANELRAHPADGELCRFRQLRRHDGETEEVEYVETPKGDLHRLIARNGKALAPDEARKEDERIEELVKNPHAFQRHMKSSEEDGEEERHLLEMLPYAFEYRYVSNENKLIELGFKPQPSFRPARREGTVFHDMEGTILVDPSEERIAGIKGHLVNEVKFGGGFLGHLEKGGTFTVQRKDVGNGHWAVTRLEVNMDGRMLLLKTISVHHDEQNSDFQPVRPGITLEEAYGLLKKDASPGSSSARFPVSLPNL